MKNILVLTDFSKNAAHAAEVAVNVAAHLNANLLLFHSFVVDPALPYTENGPWLNEVYTLQTQEAKRKLEGLKEHLAFFIEQVPASYHKPAIKVLAATDSLGTQVRELGQQKNLEMIVMGARSQGAFEHFLFGSETSTVIDKSNVPVLIVPLDADLRHINKIVYASDIDRNDSAAISYLTEFAGAFRAKLEIAHIEPFGEDEHEKTSDESALVEELVQLKRGDITYQKVRGKDVVQRLERFCTDEKADILAILHHTQSFFRRVLQQSNTREVLHDRQLPVLVLPSGM